MFRKLVRVVRKSGEPVGVYLVQLKSQFADRVYEERAIDIAIAEGDLPERVGAVASICLELESPVAKPSAGPKPRFLRDPKVAAEVGRKGGTAVKPENRTFKSRPGLATRAGQKGGLAKAANKRGPKTGPEAD